MDQLQKDLAASESERLRIEGDLSRSLKKQSDLCVELKQAGMAHEELVAVHQLELEALHETQRRELLAIREAERRRERRLEAAQEASRRSILQRSWHRLCLAVEISQKERVNSVIAYKHLATQILFVFFKTWYRRMLMMKVVRRCFLKRQEQVLSDAFGRWRIFCFDARSFKKKYAEASRQGSVIAIIIKY